MLSTYSNSNAFSLEYKYQLRKAITELLEVAHLEKGDLFVVGCSSSEVIGHKIGSFSSVDVAKALFDGIYPMLKENGIYLACQCCEHLNRAIIIEKEAAIKYGLETVNVVPQPKAGGSFATTVRLSINKIGEANIICARTRPKFIGGIRAHYDESKF